MQNQFVRERSNCACTNLQYSKPNTSLPKPRIPLWVIVVVTILALVAAKPFIEFDEHGIPKLAEWRAKKLIQELEELDGAEQYVLLTEENGTYPCYSCPNSTSIYLRKGMVWKYGMTTKGKSGRYKAGLPDKRLHYQIQFEGTIEQCLKEERRKIYSYALLPENVVRSVPLIRPPGNKRDN